MPLSSRLFWQKIALPASCALAVTSGTIAIISKSYTTLVGALVLFALVTGLLLKYNAYQTIPSRMRLITLGVVATFFIAAITVVLVVRK